MKMCIWHERDHGLHTEQLTKLAVAVQSAFPEARLGSSGAGEITIKYDPEAQLKEVGFSSFYARSRGKHGADSWRVMRVLNGENYEWLLASIEEVITFIADFGLIKASKIATK